MKKFPKFQYTLLDEMTASPHQPMKQVNQDYHLGRIRTALKNIESGDSPSNTDWQICSDPVNFMETLIKHNDGHWLDCDGDVVQIQDERNLLLDAITAMAMAGKRCIDGRALRLDGHGIQAMRGIIDDYEALVQVLPHRTMVKVHRRTERRIMQILAGKGLPSDVQVIAL